mmetsp:Transcript_128393/g.324070  ORF Transcript_128393/g.324070 Transcript_128393/m.324070 type:complete len:105 (+) Transcript_128393:278-592(+)
MLSQNVSTLAYSPVTSQNWMHMNSVKRRAILIKAKVFCSSECYSKLPGSGWANHPQGHRLWDAHRSIFESQIPSHYYELRSVERSPKFRLQVCRQLETIVFTRR